MAENAHSHPPVVESRSARRPLRFLCFIGAVFVTAACSDNASSPTAPQRPHLKLGEGNEPVVVSNVITTTDRAGKSHSFTAVQRLRPIVRNGIAMSMVITDSSAQATGYTQPLTPVLAVHYAWAPGNYTQTVTDTTTMKNYRVVATGPMIYNYPVTDIYTYNSAGYKLTEQHYTWTPVTGGFALLKQTEVSYTSAHTVAATVVSTVTNPATYALNDVSGVSVHFASLLHGVKCWFQPQVAFAQEKQRGGAKSGSGGVTQPNSMPLPGVGCWGSGTVFAFNLGAIVVESITEIETGWEVGNYLGSWTSFGHATVDFFECLDNLLGAAPRCKPGINCTSGGSGF